MSARAGKRRHEMVHRRRNAFAYAFRDRGDACTRFKNLSASQLACSEGHAACNLATAVAVVTATPETFWSSSHNATRASAINRPNLNCRRAPPRPRQASRAAARQGSEAQVWRAAEAALANKFCGSRAHRLHSKQHTNIRTVRSSTINRAIAPNSKYLLGKARDCLHAARRVASLLASVAAWRTLRTSAAASATWLFRRSMAADGMGPTDCKGGAHYVFAESRPDCGSCECCLPGLSRRAIEQRPWA